MSNDGAVTAEEAHNDGAVTSLLEGSQKVWEPQCLQQLWGEYKNDGEGI